MARKRDLHVASGSSLRSSSNFQTNKVELGALLATAGLFACDMQIDWTQPALIVDRTNSSDNLPALAE